MKVHNISNFCWFWLTSKLHCGKITSNTSRLGTFSPFFVCLIIFLCYQIISWFQGFVFLAYIHLLFWALIFSLSCLCVLNRRISGECFMFLCCTQYNLEYVILNMNRPAVPTHHSMLEVLSWVYFFCSVFWFFSICNRYTNCEEQHVYLSFSNLIFAIS